MCLGVCLCMFAGMCGYVCWGEYRGGCANIYLCVGGCDHMYVLSMVCVWVCACVHVCLSVSVAMCMQGVHDMWN